MQLVRCTIGAQLRVLTTPRPFHYSPGKTTLVRHILQNSSERIACIVNDVAAVNIDAKLISTATRGGKSSTTDLADTIELENGCVCKSLRVFPPVSFTSC